MQRSTVNNSPVSHVQYTVPIGLVQNKNLFLPFRDYRSIRIVLSRVFALENIEPTLNQQNTPNQISAVGQDKIHKTKSPLI